VTQHAHGTFEVTITPDEPDDRIRRFRIEKAWSCDLTGLDGTLALFAQRSGSRNEVGETKG
jgi:hypothetical protein